MTSTELKNFAAAVFDAPDIVELRRLHPTEAGRKAWCTAAELPAYAAALLDENRAGFSIFAGINPRRERGLSGNPSISLAHTHFADFDGIALHEAIARTESVQMPRPSMIISSGHGFHFYWRLKPATTCMEGWSERQKDLAAIVGSDPKVCNAERVMRLPGFINPKRKPFVMAEIVDASNQHYHPADLPIPLRDGSDTPPTAFAFHRIEATHDSGDRVSRCRAYLEKIPSAISGAGGHTATWYAANLCNRFGLAQAEAVELMTWYSTSKCDPPWSDREIQHKVKDAYGRNAGQHAAKVRAA